ncbi:MAG: malto-oligosyltrehalose trehalohydrolase [Acidimicrobiales bacterium]
MASAEGERGSAARLTHGRHGAFPEDGGRTWFGVWAPRAQRVDLVVGDAAVGTLERARDGYHTGTFDAPAGSRYRYLLDGRGPFADPASRSQPEGIHGPSEVVARHRAEPVAGWRGLPMSAHVLCEIHVGAFSPTGTFDGVSAALGELAAAGYTAIELMPVAAFGGERNWGYDGVFPFAVQSSYGGRDGLRRLCTAAHGHDMAVVLDVVYNHFGPDGCVLDEYGPYTTARYRTPWGRAVNFDGEGSDEVRRFFVEHALAMSRELGVDGFRLDAVHEIADQTASPFVAVLTAALHAEGRRTGRTITVVAESPANDPRLVLPAVDSGLGLDGVWNDDFHHALRVSLTGQHDRYFGDYHGVADLATACTEGFVVAARDAPSRARHHGARPAGGLDGDRLVVFAQNHDQIGNGGLGTRLAAALPLDAQFPIAAAVLLSGSVPLRFMGEEYGETAPFHYFTDHRDPALARAVREGRREEIGRATAAAEAAVRGGSGGRVRGGVRGGDGGEPPDPQAQSTFDVCRLRRTLASEGVHAELLAWQRDLLALRAAEPALGTLEPARSSCWWDAAQSSVALVRRATRALGALPVVIACTFGDRAVELAPPVLAWCTLEVLAARGATVEGVHDGGGRALGAGDTVGPGADGETRVHLRPYGVVIARVVEPAGGQPTTASGVRLGATAPLPT